jgi:hypothetical protein
VSCRRRQAPRCYRENEVSAAERRPMAHRGKPHGCPVRVVLLEVYWHGLTNSPPRFGRRRETRPRHQRSVSDAYPTTLDSSPSGMEV